MQDTQAIDETPYRAFLYEYFGLFFRGLRDEAWRGRWPDASLVITGLCGGEAPGTLPDALEVERACATAFYGVGAETVPLAQSCWESDKQLNCGDACRKCRELYARHGLVNDCPDHLPDDHAGIVLPFAAELLRRGEDEALRCFIVHGIGSWWPLAEAALRARPEWTALGPVLEPFGRFLTRELELVQAKAA